MNQITNIPPTMSSREIAELTGKQHKDVLYDTRNMLAELSFESGKAVAEFSATAQIPGPNNSTRTVQVFNLPKRECLILVSGYSLALRAKIIDRWQELEQQTTVTQSTDPAVRAVNLAGAAADALKASNTSRLGMVRQAFTLFAPQCLSMLPTYTAEAPEGVVAISSHVHCSLTHLLPLHGVTAKASAFNLILLHHGVLEAKTRASRATPGGVKSFWALTDKGLAYGVNQVHPSSPSETQPRWFEKTFPDLIAMLRQAGATI